jgi:acyl carrier protein
MTARDLRIAIIGGGVTSLSLIDVACAAEDRFGVRVPDDDLKRFVTLGDAVDFLRAAGAEG